MDMVLFWRGGGDLFCDDGGIDISKVTLTGDVLFHITESLRGNDLFYITESLRGDDLFYITESLRGYDLFYITDH